MVCRITLRATSPDGERYDAPVDELLEDAEEEEAGEQTEPEEWLEVDRETEQVQVNENLSVDRIITVTFEKPSGKRIKLVFTEAQGA